MEPLKDRLRKDLTEAIRARDEAAKSALRGVLTSISKAEVSGKEHTALTDEQVLQVIQSEVRKRQEAAGIYSEAGRAELAEREEAEAEALSFYLPPELDAAELERIVAEEIEQAAAGGVAGLKAMGPVIKAVRDRVGAQADGARVAQAVKAALLEG